MSMRICVIAVLVLAVGMHIIIDPLLRLMNLPDILYQDTRSYILIVAEGLWAMMAYNFFSAVLRHFFRFRPDPVRPQFSFRGFF